MKGISVLAAVAALSLVAPASAAAATIFTIHAEGTATGHLASLGVFYTLPVPITIDATIDFSQGLRTTAAPIDKIDGGGTADVDIESSGQLATTGWGVPGSTLLFFDAGATSTFGLAMFDPGAQRLVTLTVNRPGDIFTDLDTLPTGELCVAANLCIGGIVDPGGGTVGNNVQITWSSVTASVENTAVPEPTTWALMILGFGGAGALLRRQRAIFA